MYYNDNDTANTQAQRDGSPSQYTLPPIASTAAALPPLQPQSEPEYPYQQSKSTYSYSPYLESNNNDRVVMQQHEEYYYPVYDGARHDWPEAPVLDNASARKKKRKEMNERMKSIHHEFMENRQVLYSEKSKQLQEELMAVEKGTHETYNEHVADLEEQRRQTIYEAHLMMIYQISSVDQEFNMTAKIVQEESMAERRELQNAMFTVIEEKRKKLKEDKDGEGELGVSTHQTRNRKRMLRKRGELMEGYLIQQVSPVINQQKKKQDRAKESPSHLLNVLSNRVEEEIEADFHAMTMKRKKLQ